MNDNEHFVEFEIYCLKCKHRELKPDEQPCSDCLSVPARKNTYKPIKFEEDKKINYKKEKENIL